MARKARVFKPVRSNLEIDKQIALIKENELNPRYNSEYLLQTRHSVRTELRNERNAEKVDAELERIEEELDILEIDIKAFESIVAQLEAEKKSNRSTSTPDSTTPED